MEGTDLPPIVLEQIEHFFTHYKDLEPEKWVRVGKWGDAEAARKVIERLERAAREVVHGPVARPPPARRALEQRRGRNSLRKLIPTVRPIGSSRSGW